MQRQKTAGQGAAVLSPEHWGLPEAGRAHPGTEREAQSLHRAVKSATLLRRARSLKTTRTDYHLSLRSYPQPCCNLQPVSDNSLGVMSANSSILEMGKLRRILLVHRAWNQWKTWLAEILEKNGFRARKKNSASHSESSGPQLDNAAQTSQSCLTNA